MNVSYRFVIISTLFVTCLITANILFVKQIPLGPLVLPAAIIIFPLSYILGDILTEVYGYKHARRVIWLGFLCNLLAVIALWIAKILPPAPTFEAQAAFERILGSQPFILTASFIAYLAGEFANSFVLAKMKIVTRGRWLWTRTIGSTIVGQGIDTIIILTTVAFAGVIPFSVLGIMILSHWSIKVAYETIATPFTYRLVNYLKKKDNIDFYDFETNFNPIKIS
jgi:uncharacterized integral membrane protein (TIGR00697 family)